MTDSALQWHVILTLGVPVLVHVPGCICTDAHAHARASQAARTCITAPPPLHVTYSGVLPPLFWCFTPTHNAMAWCDGCEQILMSDIMLASCWRGRAPSYLAWCDGCEGTDGVFDLSAYCKAELSPLLCDTHTHTHTYTHTRCTRGP